MGCEHTVVASKFGRTGTRLVVDNDDGYTNSFQIPKFFITPLNFFLRCVNSTYFLVFVDNDFTSIQLRKHVFTSQELVDCFVIFRIWFLRVIVSV